MLDQKREWRGSYFDESHELLQWLLVLDVHLQLDSSDATDIEYTKIFEDVHLQGGNQHWTEIKDFQMKTTSWKGLLVSLTIHPKTPLYWHSFR